MNPGERALWVAVLALAIEDLNGASQTLSRAAFNWITSTSRNVGSYNWICHQVEIDPAYLRGGLDLKTPPPLPTATPPAARQIKYLPTLPLSSVQL